MPTLTGKIRQDEDYPTPEEIKHEWRAFLDQVYKLDVRHRFKGLSTISMIMRDYIDGKLVRQ